MSIFQDLVCEVSLGSIADILKQRRALMIWGGISHNILLWEWSSLWKLSK